MRAVSPGEVWMADLGLAAKVRPALLLTGNPALNELDFVTVVLHTTSQNRRRMIGEPAETLLERVRPPKTRDHAKAAQV